MYCLLVSGYSSSASVRGYNTKFAADCYLRNVVLLVILLVQLRYQWFVPGI